MVCSTQLFETMSFLSRLFKTLAVNLTSRKLWMTLVALWVAYAVYWASVACLYTFEKPEQLTAFVTLTQNYQYVVSIMLLSYLGIQTAANWSSGAANQMQSIVQNVATASKTESAHRVIVDEKAKNANLREHKDDE